MADVPGLAQGPDGRRYAWSGYDWVQVPRDFDPRESAFVGGLTREVNRFGAGLQQIIAGIRGDDAALASLATTEELEEWAQVARSRNNPIAGLLGRMAPYVVAGGAAGAAAGGGAGASVVAGTVADASLAGLSYGSAAERGVNAALALGGGAAAGVLGRAVTTASAAGRARRAGVSAIEDDFARQRPPDLPGPMAGGASGAEEAAGGGIGRKMYDNVMKVLRNENRDRMQKQTAQLRAMARDRKIKLHPSAANYSNAMRNIEAAIQSDPMGAGPYMRTQAAFNNRLEQSFKDALELSNYQGPIDREFMRAAEDRISDKFLAVAEASKPVQTEDIVTQARQLYKENQAGYTQQIEDTFERQIKLIEANGAQLQGRAAWTLQRQFAKEAADTAGRKGDAWARMFYSISEAIENQIVDAAEGGIDAAELQLMRKQFRMLRRFNIRGVVDDLNGLSFNKGLRAMSDEFDEYRLGRGFATDGVTEEGFEYGDARNAQMGQMNEFFRMLQIGQLFKQGVGDSGTATRLAFQTGTLNPVSMVARAVFANMYYGLTPAA